MLALLPAFGLVLGIAVGGDPIGWLLGTPLGVACLVLGLILIALGLFWLWLSRRSPTVAAAR